MCVVLGAWMDVCVCVICTRGANVGKEATDKTIKKTTKNKKSVRNVQTKRNKLCDAVKSQEETQSSPS